MKISKLSFFFKGGLLVMMLAASVQAQTPTPPPLLGPADARVGPTRTRAGFMVHGRGFIGRDNPKRISKTSRWLTNHGAGHLTEPFALEAGFVSDDFYLPGQTDDAWASRKAAWTKCGGRWAQVARGVNPRTIPIYIEDRPFTHPAHPGLRLAGLTDGKMIRVSVLSLQGIATNPRAAWLTTYREALEHEMGNLLGELMGIPWTGYANEIGVKSPCGRQE
jgi:hypothetical protein